jgi:hypothetical protein
MSSGKPRSTLSDTRPKTTITAVTIPTPTKRSTAARTGEESEKPGRANGLWTLDARAGACVEGALRYGALSTKGG